MTNAAGPVALPGVGTILGPPKGSVRIVDPSKGERCTSAETAVAISAQGATGPAGPTGPVGPAGPPGHDGALGYQKVTQQFDVTGSQLFDVPCPSGKIPVGGGARLSELFRSNWAFSDLFVGASSVDDAGTGWAAWVQDNGAATTGVEAIVTAICITS